MMSRLISLRVSLLFLCFGAKAALGAFDTPRLSTTGCIRPCLAQRCPNVTCPGGLVVDNEICPCCYWCAQQEGEECDAETENEMAGHRYCDAGLVCQQIGVVANRAIGRCVGELYGIDDVYALLLDL